MTESLTELKLSPAPTSKFEYRQHSGKFLTDDTIVEAIVKVDVSEYVPPDIDVRARVDAHLFTASGPLVAFKQLENDAHVVSISVSRPLRLMPKKD